MACLAYSEYMSSLELALSQYPIELVLPLEMIVEIVGSHLKHIHIRIQRQRCMGLIVRIDILLVVVQLKQIEHSICGILSVTFN